MSTLITEAHVKQYDTNVIMLFQQEGSLLRGTTLEKRVTGHQAFFERLGQSAAQLKTVRHGATPQNDQQHSRRMVTMSDYEDADLFDPQDDIRTLIDPTGKYVQNMVWSLGRALDDVVITAFDGTAKAGQDGGTDVSFDAGHTIANGGTGLTVSKLRTASRIIDEDDVRGAPRFIVISPKGKEQLLEDSQVTSSDFNTVRALVNGEIDTYMGFKFIISNRLNKTGNIRDAFAWVPQTMGVAIGMDMTTRVSERDDLSYSTQVYASATFGATRVQEEGIVKIGYDESV